MACIDPVQWQRLAATVRLLGLASSAEVPWYESKGQAWAALKDDRGPAHDDWASDVEGPVRAKDEEEDGWSEGKVDEEEWWYGDPVTVVESPGAGAEPKPAGWV